MDTIKRVLSILTAKEKKQVVGLLALMIIGAALEVVGVSLIVPFIHLINNPSAIYDNKWLNKVYNLLTIGNERNFLVLVGLLLFGVYFLKSLYFILFYHLQNKFLRHKRVRLSKELVSFYLLMPYKYHLQRNLSEINRNISAASRMVDSVLLSLMIITTETIVVAVIILLLLVAQPLAAAMAFGVVGMSATLMYKFVKSKLSHITKEQFFHSTKVNKCILEAFGGIKEIKTLGREKYFIELYSKHFDMESMWSQYMTTVNQVPRLFVEMVLVGTVVLLVIVALHLGSSTASLIPLLALFAVSALRVMPSINRIITSFIMFRHGQFFINLVEESIADIKKEYVAQPEKSVGQKNNLIFEKNIEIKDISYMYTGSELPVISNIDIQISKGNSIALVGHSGAGKTTLVDIVLGLLKPTTGGIYVDGAKINTESEEWRTKLGYIPQQIFLADDTIRRNIAFGLDDHEIDESAVVQAVKDAQLEHFISTLPAGLDTVIGERGVRLSGGQRQRIGIARCLFRNSEILVLDEATAALDNETEQNVVKAIEKLKGKKTIIIIAHRLSTVSKCDKLYYMDNGKVKDSGTFDSLVKNNSDFARFAQV